MTFGEKLDKLIGDRKTSQKEVGAAIGVHQTRISDLTRGEGEVNRTQLIKLARFFGVSADWLGDDSLDEQPAGFTDAERTALDLVRELGLPKGEVIRRLAGPAAAPRPLTTDDIEVRPRPRPEDSPRGNPGGESPPRRRTPKIG